MRYLLLIARQENEQGGGHLGLPLVGMVYLIRIQKELDSIPPHERKPYNGKQQQAERLQSLQGVPSAA